MAPAAAGLTYGMGRVDGSGRVYDREVLRALRWQCGDRLTVTAISGVVAARLDPGGLVVVPAPLCVVIPGPLRRRCGLETGDRVLLAADPAGQVLTAWSMPAVDQVIRAHLPSGLSGEMR